MAHLGQRNESEYYPQSDLMSNMNSLSIHNRSSINIPPSSIGANSTVPEYPLPPVSSSAPNMTPRPCPTKEWKKSSSDNGWKTSSGSNLSSKKNIEGWKMSGKPRHAQLANIQQQQDRRQSAPIANSWPKPLPQEPPHHEPCNLVYPPSTMMEEQQLHYTTFMQAPFHTTLLQPPAFIRPVSEYHAYPTQPTNHYPPPTNNNHLDYIPSIVDYNHYHQPQDCLNNNEYPMDHYSPSIIEQEQQYQLKPTTLQSPPLQSPPSSQKSDNKKKDSKPEKKVRQITVQSINIEHRVWIDVLPAETGLSLAEKIHIIATFRTRKIVSITTASGRKVPLDNRPVFGSWMDMESFQDGEKWTVEWRENDRGVVDKFMSKIIQAGGGKRSKDHVAKE